MAEAAAAAAAAAAVAAASNPANSAALAALFANGGGANCVGVDGQHVESNSHQQQQQNFAALAQFQAAYANPAAMNMWGAQGQVRRKRERCRRLTLFLDISPWSDSKRQTKNFFPPLFLPAHALSVLSVAPIPISRCTALLPTLTRCGCRRHRWRRRSSNCKITSSSPSSLPPQLPPPPKAPSLRKLRRHRCSSRQRRRGPARGR